MMSVVGQEGYQRLGIHMHSPHPPSASASAYHKILRAPAQVITLSMPLKPNEAAQRLLGVVRQMPSGKLNYYSNPQRATGWVMSPINHS